MALQVLWFILWGLLWAVYFMLDGFDFGSIIMRPFVSKDDADRKVVLHTIGPVWDGNEVWLITAGGATFAAFPAAYASMFSFLYMPMLIVLFCLIGRGVAVEFRAKDEAAQWHSVWDWVMWATSLLVSFFFGLIFGNIFRGLPITAGGYLGTFGGMFNFYGILSGVLFAGLFVSHGALWLGVKAEGDVAERSVRFAKVFWFVVLAVAVVFLISTAFATKLYDNYLAHPVWIIVPLLAVLALLGVRVALARERRLFAFFASCAVIVLVTFTGIIGLYPNLIPSTADPASSITLFNASSSQKTLTVMTVVVAIFVPIVIAYQIVVYRFFRQKVSRNSAGEVEAY